VLPEAYDPRILKAAAMLANKGIVKLILLGNRQDIQRVMDKTSMQTGSGWGDPHPSC
jgi:phosphotransacetylase